MANKAKEDYLKNVKGYSQKNGKWYDSNNNEVSKGEINQIKYNLNAFDVVNANNSGEYNTKTSYDTNIKPTLETAERLSKGFNLNETSSDFVTEALLRFQAGPSDDDKEFFAKLTDTEKAALSSQMVTTGAGSTTLSGVSVDSGYSVQQVQDYLQLTGDLQRSIERQRDDLKSYNTVLASSAEGLGTTAQALEFFGHAMYNASEESNDFTKESAKNIAAQYKFNKAYNATVSVYYDNKDAIKAYGKAIKNNEEISYDLADAMGELSISLKEMGLSLSAETISDKLSTIEKLLTDSSIKNAPIIPTNLKKAINYIAQHYSARLSRDICSA